MSRIFWGGEGVRIMTFWIAFRIMTQFWIYFYFGYYWFSKNRGYTAGLGCTSVFKGRHGESQEFYGFSDGDLAMYAHPYTN